MFRIEIEIARGIDRRDEGRISAGGRVETARRYRCGSGVEMTKLAGQHALTESAVARAQHRAAVSSELCGDAQPRRPGCSTCTGPEPRDALAWVSRPCIERLQVLAGGAAVIEAQSEVDVTGRQR